MRIEHDIPEIRYWSKSLPSQLWPLENWQTITIISLDKYIAVAIGDYIINVAKCESLSGNGSGILAYSGHGKIHIDIDNVYLWDISDLEDNYIFDE